MLTCSPSKLCNLPVESHLPSVRGADLEGFRENSSVPLSPGLRPTTCWQGCESPRPARSSRAAGAGHCTPGVSVLRKSCWRHKKLTKEPPSCLARRGRSCASFSNTQRLQARALASRLSRLPGHTPHRHCLSMRSALKPLSYSQPEPSMASVALLQPGAGPFLHASQLQPPAPRCPLHCIQHCASPYQPILQSFVCLSVCPRLSSRGQ